jgi:ACS family tartrate transporter-like MFS transporter
MDEMFQRSVLRKVATRLVPFLFLLYMINILDRVNVGFAKLQMLSAIGLDEKEGERVYGMGYGIFYVGYLLFEVPSNLIMRRTGARRWISRIMISWGLITCAMMFVVDAWSFYFLRTLLGVAEAGFFPGMILYLTYWFPARERARVVALSMAAAPITGVLGNPLSGAIMDYMDMVGGLRDWQWVFLLEGLPAVVLGVVVLFYLTDRPEQAGWLLPEERDWLSTRLAGEEKHRLQRHSLSLGKALTNGRVLLLILLYFTVAAGANAFGGYLPTLIKDRFGDISKLEVGLLAAIPNLFAVAAMILNGYHSDRTGERRWHVAVPAFVCAVGWAICALCEDPLVTLVGLTLIQAGVMSTLPVFWSLPTAFLGGIAAAGGIALINSVGNLGGLAAPNIIGQFKAATGSFTGGLLVMAVILAAGSVLAICVRHDHATEGKTL